MPYLMLGGLKLFVKVIFVVQNVFRMVFKDTIFGGVHCMSPYLNSTALLFDISDPV